MLLKKSIDWEDIDIKKIKRRGNVEFVVLGILLGLALLGLVWVLSLI